METKEKLSVKFCGIDLKNSVVAASAIPSRNFGEMKYLTIRKYRLINYRFPFMDRLGRLISPKNNF
ncbi:MAG: hypothetical protein PHW73_05280 [Atribacterota bacterium]|nr:hypothetical protein [Atribacterota bacterium]